MSKPTVGRVVWFHPGLRDTERMMVLDGQQPMRADVVFVHNDRMVNLMVTDHAGGLWPRDNVELIQEGDAIPKSQSYCEWMPYQKGQAAKAEALERQIHPPGSPHIATSSSEIHR
jgi:hypothetical protein